MEPTTLPVWFWELLRHPLFIACVSTVIFGGIVSFIGARLQHRNWKKQEEISSNKVAQEKLFDKRAEIIRRLFYLNKQREQNVWNYYHEMKRQKEANRERNPDLQVLSAQYAREYRDAGQELVSESNALLEEMKIYFGVNEESDLLKNFLAIWDIWHRVFSKIGNEEITEDDINQESKKVNAHREEIQKRLQEIIYRVRPHIHQIPLTISTAESNAATPLATVMTESSGVSSPAEILYGKKS